MFKFREKIQLKELFLVTESSAPNFSLLMNRTYCVESEKQIAGSFAFKYHEGVEPPQHNICLDVGFQLNC